MFVELTHGWEMKGSYSGFWRFGRSMELNLELKGFMDWIPAEVPGSVHWSLHQAGLLPDPYWDKNTPACEWVNERDWLYRTSFDADPAWEGKRIRLICEGIDESATLLLNGHELGRHEGMFVPFVLDITDFIDRSAPNKLIIALDKSPDGQAQLGYTDRVNHLKSRFGYKWDFCPRLVHIGIWKHVKLEITGEHRIENIHVTSEITEGVAIISADTSWESEVAGDIILEATVLTSEGAEAAFVSKSVSARPGLQRARLELQVPEPRLWWPNNEGDSTLYRLHVAIRIPGDSPQLSDEKTENFGIRQLSFKSNPGAPRDAQPFTICVNGRELYIRGWNFVPIDQLYGRYEPERYEKLIALAKAANINLLRVWGGGLIEREAFYDLCDRNGIMVWQEMMQSSSGFNNEPSSNPEFLYRLISTMRSVIREKRNHPSLVIWCGGNELTEGGHLDEELIPLSDKHTTLRELGRLVHDLDPERLFLATSPTGPTFFLSEEVAGKGRSYDVHGPWKYGGAESHYRLYNGSDALLQSEFGGDGYCSLTSMRKFLPSDAIQADQTGSWSWIHHGGEYWNMDAQLSELFGTIADMATKVQLSQWLQAEGIRYGLEANRRRAPKCSGSILWQMNEPYPNATCTSAVDYYGDPKLAYSWVARANAPSLISMSYGKAAYAPNERFAGEVVLHIDELETPAEYGWCVTILDQCGSIVHQVNGVQRVEQRNIGEFLCSIDWPVPEGIETFFVRLEAHSDGRTVHNEYSFTVSQSAPPLASYLSLLRTELQVFRTREEDGSCTITIRNGGATVAMWVRVEVDVNGGGSTSVSRRPLSDGFLLFPGEENRLAAYTKTGSGELWTVSALNSLPINILFD